MEEAEYYTKLYEEFEKESEELKSSEPQKLTPQRDPSEVLSWSKFFMAVAFLSAQRSHDPNTQVLARLYHVNDYVDAYQIHMYVHDFFF